MNSKFPMFGDFCRRKCSPFVPFYRVLRIDQGFGVCCFCHFDLLFFFVQTVEPVIVCACLLLHLGIEVLVLILLLYIQIWLVKLAANKKDVDIIEPH